MGIRSACLTSCNIERYPFALSLPLLSLSLSLSLLAPLCLLGVIIINARPGPAWKSERTDIWAVPVYNI